MATLLANVDLSDWSVGDLQTTKRGQKAAPIFFQSGLPPQVCLTTPTEPMNAPFGASAYQDPDAIRLTMELVASPGQIAKLQAIDAWALEAGKSMGCKGEFKGLLSEDKNGGHRMRVKVNTTGNLISRLWDNEKTQIPWTRELGNELRHAKVRPIVCLSKIWSSGVMFGITAELRQAVCELQSASHCPEFL